MSKYNILIMGASYGSLLASKILFGGHSVKLVCLPAEAAIPKDFVFEFRSAAEANPSNSIHASCPVECPRRDRQTSTRANMTSSASRCRSPNTDLPECGSL